MTLEPEPARDALAGRLAQLSPEKRAVFERLRQRKGLDDRRVAAIARRSTSGPAPLSYVQQRLWLFDQLQGGSPAYNVLIVLRSRTELAVPVLERCLSEIVRRHEILRTTFPIIEGQPVQSVSTGLATQLEIIDLRGSGSGDIETRRIAEEEARRSFDLSHGPLLRATLLRLGGATDQLLLAMHHIICDGWSVGILARELSDVYAAYSRGGRAPLGSLPIQYLDYAEWERNWLTKSVLDEQVTFWKHQLQGAPPQVALPFDFVSPSRRSYAGGSLSFRLPADLVDTLKELGRCEGATLFMVLLAALKTLLYRCSGQDDLVVGTPIAVRNRSEIEGLVGCFVNTLVLRTDLSGNPTFVELLSRVRQVTLGAFDHQDVPFERLAEALRPERSSTYLPPIQVVFALLNAADEAPGSGALFEHEEVHNGGSKFDLTVAVSDAADGLAGTVEFSSELFAYTTIERLVGHWRTLLGAMAADPGCRLAELPLLSPGERRQLLVDWNATTTAFPAPATLPELFAAQAARTPEAVALVSGDEVVSYRGLRGRVGRLAAELRRRGVGPETLVGVCLERSVDLVVALLAVLEAGGAYVPLDPAYPPARLGYMLTDSRPRLVLTHSGLCDRLQGHGQVVELLCLDVELPGQAARGDQDPPGGSDRLSPDNLAYVIYTSGSTGHPKGVMITHRALVNFWNHISREVGIDREVVVLAITNVCFDIACLELLLPLAAGARIVIGSQGLAADPWQLAERIRTSDATVVQATPASWELLVGSGWSGNVKTTILCGGDVLAPHLVPKLVERSRVAWNLYGPTEATIWTTSHRLECDEVAPPVALEGEAVAPDAGAPYGPFTGAIVRSSVPIGRPFANTRVYVLDGGMHPVPIGVAGELFVGGAGLARGYWQRPGLTAERFVPDPFAAEPGGRLYRTGDLVRFRPDGELEFLGRVDEQVKVRGFRIELGEIEATLGRHPGVQACAVVARPAEAAGADSGGERRLVAYVVSRAGELEVLALRRYLQAHLPDYMLPAVFVELAALPLTPNGKVDRARLPAPPAATSPAPADLTEEAACPRGEVESALASIWAGLLGRERVGREENFFEVGGDSILSIQLVSRAHAAGWQLTPRQVFDHPTIAALAVVARPTRQLGVDDPAATPEPPLVQLDSAGQARLVQLLEALEDPGLEP